MCATRVPWRRKLWRHRNAPNDSGSVLFTFVLLFSGLASLSQPAVAQNGTGDPGFYCNFGNQPSPGSVADWWADDQVAPDCINLTVSNSPETCSLDASFYSHVVLKDGTKSDNLYWWEIGGTGEGQSSTGFTISFPKDDNGGSVTVQIAFNSPESDIGVGLSDFEKAHWFYTTYPYGVEYTINTDCQQNEVQWCSPGYWKNKTANWR